MLLAAPAASSFAQTARQSAPRTADQWYAQGQRQLKAGQAAPAAASFRRAAELNPSAANWRALAEALVAAGDLAGASAAYDQAIRGYRVRGDTVTANALENRAAPYRQVAEFYVLNPASAPTVPAPTCARTRAKFEPSSGMYLGLYVDEQGIAPDGSLLAGPLNTPFSVYFRYFRLRAPQAGTPPADLFPTRFVEAVKRAGAAAHISLEPALPLREVSEATVLPFAQAARAAGIPIFLRFASEFNDPANEWSRDPALYRARFRLVHDLMARVAPNVAMVWMPMPSRLEVVDSYYPGADAVDWVGVSLYSVPFRNGDTDDSTLRLSPLDVLRPFYDRYACAHPFQVSEFAASHRSEARPDVDYTAFATEKMRMLFWGAALRYPRLKNINWLDVNMIGGSQVQSRATTRLNDYRLQAVPAKVSTYRELLSEPYFRTRFDPAATTPQPIPFPATLQVRETLRGAVWLSTVAAPQRVVVTLDGAPVPTAATLPYRFNLSPAQLGPGRHVLALNALGAGGRVLMQKTHTFTVLP